MAEVESGCLAGTLSVAIISGKVLLRIACLASGRMAHNVCFLLSIARRFVRQPVIMLPHTLLLEMLEMLEML